MSLFKNKLYLVSYPNRSHLCASFNRNLFEGAKTFGWLSSPGEETPDHVQRIIDRLNGIPLLENVYIKRNEITANVLDGIFNDEEEYERVREEFLDVVKMEIFAGDVFIFQEINSGMEPISSFDD